MEINEKPLTTEEELAQKISKVIENGSYSREQIREAINYVIAVFLKGEENDFHAKKAKLLEEVNESIGFFNAMKFQSN